MLLHVIGDIIQSFGVVVAALIIKIKGNDWSIVDPLCTVFFSILVVITTVPMFKDCIHILMEGTPARFDLEQIEKDLGSLKEIEEIHDLHLWSLSKAHVNITAHIKT